jgi:hypothetical protein
MSALTSPAVVTAFKICLKDYEILSTIDDLFMDLGFAYDVESEGAEAARAGSSRRARAAGYIDTLDLTRAGDARKLLNAISMKLAEWEQAGNSGSDLDRLRRALKINKISWDGERLTPDGNFFAGDGPSDLTARFGSEAVNEEIERIRLNLDTDPSAAITASRALVESSCKAVLERMGQSVNDKDELPALYKKAAAALRLDPTQHEEAIYKQTLQGLVSSVQGLAELRNKMGSAHGKGVKAVRPAPRHARLAAGAAYTIAIYLAETLEERLGSTLRSSDAPDGGT